MKTLAYSLAVIMFVTGWFGVLSQAFGVYSSDDTISRGQVGFIILLNLWLGWAASEHWHNSSKR